ncbi:oxidoreductase [Anopheles sinensis]|uniref:Oxidoreductase n=1 Tax=Anopheles sinensis TaxID=74873 RepID=A0A084VND5_ANOSI|nr:oxidoreductase [Anopheles sinensis]
MSDRTFYSTIQHDVIRDCNIRARRRHGTNQPIGRGVSSAKVKVKLTHIKPFAARVVNTERWNEKRRCTEPDESSLTSLQHVFSLRRSKIKLKIGLKIRCVSPYPIWRPMVVRLVVFPPRSVCRDDGGGVSNFQSADHRVRSTISEGNACTSNTTTIGCHDLPIRCSDDYRECTQSAASLGRCRCFHPRLGRSAVVVLTGARLSIGH